MKLNSANVLASTPLVSIVCPVYNVEKYINRCIDSFLAQTLSNWELIMIDDGSSDSSGFICDDFARSDDRIKVIHKENGGVSAARQTGMDAALGEYIIHADPDDWAESTMLEELYSKAKEDDADMVICDFYVDEGRSSIYKKQKPSSLQAYVVLEELFGKLHGSCWNKLVKRTCCIRYNAKFPEGINYGEDTCFNVQLLQHNIKVSYLDKAFYHYVQTPESITGHFTRKTLDMCKKYVDNLCTLLPVESKMVKMAQETIKYNVFLNEILNDLELKQLYPEIKFYKGNRIDRAIITYIAFSGHQTIAKKIYKTCNNILSFIKSICTFNKV